MKVWDLTATGRAVFTEPCDAVRKFGTAYTVAFSPDGRQLAAGNRRGGEGLGLEERSAPSQLARGQQHLHSIPVAFSRDGRLATGAFREDLKLWDTGTGLLLRTVHAHRGEPVAALAFSPDGELLASASFDRTAKLSNSRTGEVLHSFDLHTGNVECVAFSPDGRRLASGGEDKTVRVWDTTTGREVLGLRGHTDRCGCVAFSPDGRRLASASSDRTIRIWDATPLRGDEGQGTLTFTQHSHEIRSVAFGPDGPDGQRIASAGSDGLVKVWDAQTGEVSAEFSGHKEFSGRRVVVFCVAWHPKGGLIASAGNDTVRVWDARTGREAFRLAAAQSKVRRGVQPRRPLPGHGKRQQRSRAGLGCRDRPGGRHARYPQPGSLRRGLQPRWRAPGFGEPRRDREALGREAAGQASAWTRRKQPRLPLRARVAGPGVNVAFSPDGRRLATGGEENTVKIWDVQNGRELQTLRGHNGDVYTVAFSPDDDGRWVASAGEDSAVKVWDSRTGKLVRSFRGHTSVVTSVAFSPDGRRLVSGSRDHTVKVWDLTQLEEQPEDQ